MKKFYETPDIEVVEFQYTDQVVAASACGEQVINVGSQDTGTCTSGWETFTKRN
jgi:hypothetical protein